MTVSQYDDKAKASYNGIVLDNRYSRGLLRAYLEEGYITPRDNPHPVVTQRISQMVNEISTDSTKNEALLLLTLFDKVYVYFRNPDNAFDLDSLEKRDLAIPIEMHIEESTAWYADDFRALKAKGAIVGDELRLQEKPNARLTSWPITDLFTPKDLEDLDFLADLVLSRIKADSVLSEIGEGIPNFVRRLTSDPEIIPFLVNKVSRRIGVTRKYMARYIRHVLWGTREELADIRSLLRHSSDFGLPGAWYHLTQNPKQNFKLPIDNEGIKAAYWVAVQALIREVKYLPAPQTASEALSLRNSKKMQELRYMLCTWVESARTGNRPLEAEVRREIGKANRSLKRAGTCKRVAGVMTYLAVPTSIIELFLFSVPIASLPLSIVGAAIQASADATEWRHKWLLWGGPGA